MMNDMEKELQAFLQQVEKREQISRRRTLIFSLVPILLVGALLAVMSNIVIQKRRELHDINQELAQKQKRLNETTKALETITPNALKDFGWTNEKVASSTLGQEAVQQSLEANAELQQFTAKPEAGGRGAITIQYFPKDVDQKKVGEVLRALGFRLESRSPQVTDLPTNAIWFGENVELEEVKLVALTLMRAGIQIRAIERFKEPSGRKASLIQVGASRFVADDSVFTVEKLRTLTLEEIQNRSRTYGNQ